MTLPAHQRQLLCFGDCVDCYIEIIDTFSGGSMTLPYKVVF